MASNTAGTEMAERKGKNDVLRQRVDEVQMNSSKLQEHHLILSGRNHIWDGISQSPRTVGISGEWHDIKRMMNVGLYY